MRALVSACLAGTLALAPDAAGAAQEPDTAAGRAAPRPARTVPRCAKEVADGARVRVRIAGDSARHTGTALGWATEMPRVVTARGDTVALHADDERSVSLGKSGRRTLQGAITGFLVGSLSNVPCLGERFCGEQNPVPGLAAGLGAVIGHQLRRERWRRVSSDPACPGERP